MTFKMYFSMSAFKQSIFIVSSSMAKKKMAPMHKHNTHPQHTLASLMSCLHHWVDADRGQTKAIEGKVTHLCNLGVEIEIMKGDFLTPNLL